MLHGLLPLHAAFAASAAVLLYLLLLAPTAAGFCFKPLVFLLLTQTFRNTITPFHSVSFEPHCTLYGWCSLQFKSGITSKLNNCSEIEVIRWVTYAPVAIGDSSWIITVAKIRWKSRIKMTQSSDPCQKRNLLSGLQHIGYRNYTFPLKPVSTFPSLYYTNRHKLRVGLAHHRMFGLSCLCR